jgi:GntR family transcriptional repressor for pyruvate dehydrogenase complex
VHATSPRPHEPQRTVHFDTIKEPKAAQRVAERVRSAIRNGELRNGDRLPPERQLIQEFGYSRAIVREALRMLEDEGLITLHAGRNGGAIIRHPGTERLMNAFDMLLRLQQTSQADFYEARRLLEPLLIRLAIERATSDDIAALRSCLEPLRARAEARPLAADAAVLDDGPADPPHTTRHFHRTLSEAAHNNVLAAVINIVMELCRRQTTTDEFDPAHLLQVHAAITDAVEARDAESATRLTLEHLEHSERQAQAQASTRPSLDELAPEGLTRDV